VIKPGLNIHPIGIRINSFFSVFQISRESIDAVKKYFKKDMSKDDWKLIIDLKKVFEIM